MTDWQGHKRVTSTALLDVITTAATGSTRPSYADRVLFTACEFWASANNGSLLEQLSEDAAAQLRAAEAAFNIIGLVQVAAIAARGREALTGGEPPASLPEVAQMIERAIAAVDEPVDQAIAAFADREAAARAVIKHTA